MSSTHNKGVKGHVTDVLVSTTQGRAKFPDLLQHSMGEKSIIGFDRYGRVVGAMVPIEAVRILAGFEDRVDDDIRERVRRAALSMLKEAPSEVDLLGLEPRPSAVVEQPPASKSLRRHTPAAASILKGAQVKRPDKALSPKRKP